MSKNKQKKQCGGSSDWMGSFYATTPVGGPGKLSRFTKGYINKAPLFNHTKGGMFPTGTSGIIPTGAYYMSGGSGHTRYPLKYFSGGGCDKQKRKQKGGYGYSNVGQKGGKGAQLFIGPKGGVFTIGRKGIKKYHPELR